MILKPGIKERKWMDDSPEKYAYRCLPLTIGNTTGWDIYPVCDFLVSWSETNQKHQSSLQIHPEEDIKFAASSFGDGIFTLHPGYLFRTDENWDLLIMGVPNEIVDWAYPLTGIVETFWNDFTFTINWKMTKFGNFHWPKERPVARIIPIPHNYEIESEIKQIKDEPELFKSFTKNAKSRNALIRDLSIAHSEKKDEGRVKLNQPKTHWEKAYYRGIDAKGNKQYNHIVKRTFPEFKKRD